MQLFNSSKNQNIMYITSVFHAYICNKITYVLFVEFLVGGGRCIKLIKIQEGPRKKRLRNIGFFLEKKEALGAV